MCPSSLNCHKGSKPQDLRLVHTIHYRADTAVLDDTCRVICDTACESCVLAVLERDAFPLSTSSLGIVIPITDEFDLTEEEDVNSSEFS